jgi:hypothetical protein
MSSRKELVETALHVLVAWIDGRKPAPADLATLKDAFPSSAHLPADELACQVIHDLSGVAFRESGQSEVPDQGIDEVA